MLGAENPVQGSGSPPESKTTDIDHINVWSAEGLNAAFLNPPAPGDPQHCNVFLDSTHLIQLID